VVIIVNVEGKSRVKKQLHTAGGMSSGGTKSDRPQATLEAGKSSPLCFSFFVSSISLPAARK